MPDPQTLAEAGGWAVAIALGSAILLGVVRRWWVPGAVYDREVRRADEAASQVAALTEAVRDLTAEIRWAIRRHGPEDR